MIDRNHPAVEAATPDIHCISLREYEPEDCHEPIADALTAAWPELTTATEDNLARLRNTPAGKQLLAEGWEAACRKVIHMAWADSSDAEYLADEGNPYRTGTPQ